jgi:undecaprenyl-diphosphatase
MGSAVAYDLLKSWDRLDFSDAGLIALGFLVAFVTALAVVRFLLDFVSRHGFAPFAWWRIAVGLIGLAGLALTGGLA